MIFKRAIAFAVACSVAATPTFAAQMAPFQETGARRSGAAVGAYLEVPFSGPRSGRPQAGLRLTMNHDYRDARAQNAPVVRSNALDLRLVGDREATVYLAGTPVTGDQARRNNLTGVGGIVGIAILVAAVVGGIVIWRAIDDSGEE